jgi:hypothetical protein
MGKEGGASFYHLVGAGEQRRRNFDAQRLRHDQIDDEIPTRYLPNDASCTIRGNGCLIAPKVFEPVRCQLGVTHRVLNVSVPEPSLQRPGVVAGVC